MKLAGRDGVEQGRKAANKARRGNAAEGLVLGEAKVVDAVGVEARAGTGAMDAACLDLGEVGEQARQELIRATDEAARGGEQLRVGELGRRRTHGSHACTERTLAERARRRTVR